MSQTNDEIDTINHLLKIEKQASELIFDAQKEAEKRITKAKSKYNTDYKAQYEKIVLQMEEQFQDSYNKITKKYVNELEQYKKSLEDKKQNKAEFYSLLEKLFFA